jgi:hypothetical protein
MCALASSDQLSVHYYAWSHAPWLGRAVLGEQDLITLFYKGSDTINRIN